MNARLMIENMAPLSDLRMTTRFEWLRRSSREPSRTIKIRPIVPITGSKGEKSGSVIFKSIETWLVVQPNNSSSITDGILVLEELRSKMYASRISIQKVIIILIVIMIKYCQNFKKHWMNNQCWAYFTKIYDLNYLGW